MGENWKNNDPFVCVWSTNQPKYKMRKVNNELFWWRSGNFLYQRENSFEVDKPKKSTIQKKKLVTKQSYSHTPDAVIVPLNLTRTYMWTPLNQTSYLKSFSMNYFSLDLISKLNFKGWSHHTNTLKELAHLTIFV